MNGDLGKIYDKVNEVALKQMEITTKVDERHTENKRLLNVLFKKIKKVEDLPCKTHIEKMNNHGIAISFLYAFIFLGVIAGIIINLF